MLGLVTDGKNSLSKTYLLLLYRYALLHIWTLVFTAEQLLTRMITPSNPSLRIKLYYQF
jgi:hypothetical protein